MAAGRGAASWGGGNSGHREIAHVSHPSAGRPRYNETMKRRFAVSAAVSLLTLALPIAGAGSLAACSEDTAPQAAAGGSAGSEAGAAGSDAAPAPSPTDVTCDGAKRLALPADFAQRGPWAVGARTVVVGGLVSEIWYSSLLGSDVG
jgi:hypothetical protein